MVTFKRSKDILTQIGGELCFAVKLGQFVKLPYRGDVFFQMKRKTDVKGDILDVEKRLWQNNGLSAIDRNGWN